jgi:hypothetical protein
MKKAKYAGIISGLCLVAIILAFGQVFSIAKIDVFYEKAPLQAKTDQIIEASGIKPRANIFTVDEKAAAKKVEAYYSDGSVDVTDIERIFPNKVLIYVKELVPVFAIPVKGDPACIVVTDENFIRNQIYSADFNEYDNIIKVSGFTVENTFNTSNIIKLKEIRKAFGELGIREEALVAFIEEIVYEDNLARIYLRNYDRACLVVNIAENENIGAGVKEKYQKFLDTQIAQRYSALF